MTYCVAWKTQSSAFIITDSLVTNRGGLVVQDDNSEVTSFQEKQGYLNDGRYVSESALKIYSADNFAISIIGDSRLGFNLIELITQHIRFGRDLDQAIEYSLNNDPEFSQRPLVELVIATYHSQPRIIVVSNQREKRITEIEDRVFVGSASQGLIDYSKRFLISFLQEWERSEYPDMRDEIIFIQMLALLQSYGIHNCTVENGIGGAYTGVRVIKNAVLSQPGVCFFITGENCSFETKKIAYTTLQDNHFCIINTDIRDLLLVHQTASVDEQRQHDVLENARACYDNGVFDYIIFLNVNRHVACILNMNQQQHHDLLSLDIRKDREGTLGFLMSRKLEILINENYRTDINDTTVLYIPYCGITQDRRDSFVNNIAKWRLERITEDLDINYKFIIYEQGVMVKWFYGSTQTVFPFLMHYKNAERIDVIELKTDFLHLEYQSGCVIFPELGFPVEELFDKMKYKINDKNIYTFDYYNNNIDDVITIKILSEREDDALAEAKRIIVEEYNDTEDSSGLIFAGMVFYYPYVF